MSNWHQAPISRNSKADQRKSHWLLSALQTGYRPQEQPGSKHGREESGNESRRSQKTPGLGLRLEFMIQQQDGQNGLQGTVPETEPELTQKTHKSPCHIECNWEKKTNSATIPIFCFFLSIYCARFDWAQSWSQGVRLVLWREIIQTINFCIVAHLLENRSRKYCPHQFWQ